ncbi:MAG TPA: PIN domain-containing protein [Rhodoferax sp.]|nr:PIN domain-containing protein [Rhodoferax sp.]
MPLPSPPSKRAALLSLKDLDAPLAKSKTRADRVQTPAAAPATPAALSAATPPLIATVTLPLSQSATAEQMTVAPQQSVAKALPRVKSKSRQTRGPGKLFVLDTNVLLHDPTCLFRFEEHDIFLPMIVLEELDAHKKGMTEVARNGRQTSRSLDALAEHPVAMSAP